MFEWADVMKYLAGAATALLGVWAKREYEIVREREALQEILLRCFHQQRGLSQGTIDLLVGSKDAITAGADVLVSIGVAPVFSRTAERLATIDPARAMLYFGYVDAVEGFEDAKRSYSALAQAYHTSTSSPTPQLISAIGKAARWMAQSMVQIDMAQLALATSSGWMPNVQPSWHDIDQLEKEVAAGKAALQRATWGLDDALP